jgi:hypothetical protein
VSAIRALPRCRARSVWAAYLTIGISTQGPPRRSSAAGLFSSLLRCRRDVDLQEPETDER